jgi:hypothetical protein
MRCIYCCFALALGLPLAALNAQEEPALAAGARVRVLGPKADCNSPEVAPCYRKVVGSLESIDSATIIIRSEAGETVRVSRAPGTRLELNTHRGGCSGRRGECVALGFLGGAALGVVVAFISVEAQGGARACGENLCELAYWLAVPAAVVGTIVGAVTGGDDWEDADVPARLSVGPDGSGGLQVGLTLPF